MYILRWIFFITIILFIDRAKSKIAINRILVRTPNQMDIGLIFDVTIVNTETEKKEMLEFRIRSDGTCCLNMTNNRIMSGAGRVVGGYFGYIEAGKTETVSLIWPTISLYNRLGSCPILVVSTNANNKEVHLKQMLVFDTRFTTLDPDGHTLRKEKNFVECNNWDKDNFKNCSPVDCEERYFGKYNFYNETSQQCEPVVRCCAPNELYDYYSNECIDSNNFCTEEDIENIKAGKFQESPIEQSSKKSNVPIQTSNIVVNKVFGNLQEGFASKTKQQEEHGDNKRSLPKRQSEVDSATEEKPTSALMPDWLQGLADGLLIVFATIAIYVLICFIIFLIVSWISRRHFKPDNTHNHLVLRTPASSENCSNIYTPSSLLSHRQ